MEEIRRPTGRPALEGKRQGSRLGLLSVALSDARAEQRREENGRPAILHNGIAVSPVLLAEPAAGAVDQDRRDFAAGGDRKQPRQRQPGDPGSESRRARRGLWPPRPSPPARRGGVERRSRSEARLVLVSREPQSAELWHWLLTPGSRYEAKPDPEGTDILIMVTRGTLTLTVEGQASQLKAGTAGHITSGAGYLLANPGRAGTAFVPVHIPPPPPAPDTPGPVPARPSSRS